MAAIQERLALSDELDVFHEDEIDLREYGRVILKYKWKILRLSVFVALLAVLIVFNLRAVFRATGTVLVESQPARVVSIEEIYGIDSSRTEYLLTQFEILKSHDLARKVVEKLNLAEHPDFMPEKSTFNWREWLPFDLPPLNDEPNDPGLADPLEAVLKTFTESLKISPRRNTQLVDISFDSPDPKLAVEVVNALGEAYIESDLEARLDTVRKANTWLSSRMQGLREKLTESERKLQEFREKERLVDVQGVVTISAKEIERTTDKLVEARNTRAAAESAYNKVRALGDKVAQNIDAVPEIFQDPGIQDLKQKEAETSKRLSELAERYGPEHPSIAGARSELESIHRLLGQQTNSIARSIRNRYEVARSNESALAASIERNKEEIQGISRKQARLQELQREVEANRNLYDMFVTRYKETSEAGNLQTAIARFIDRATVPNEPAKPKRKLIVALAFLVSLVFGVGLALLRDRLDNFVRTPADIETKLQVPLLGTVPLLKGKGKNRDFSPAAAYLEGSHPGFSEAIRTIRTSVVLCSLDDPCKVILVTSTVPGEGKSTLAFNLAVSLGQMERVLLIDADLRRPTQAKICNLGGTNRGLAYLLANPASQEECVMHHEATNIDVIPAGFVPPNPSELLSSRAFTGLVEEMTKKYDAVVIDSPPVQAVSDTQLLVRYVRSVIYVIEADKTPVPAARAGLKRLQRLGAPLSGAVVSKLDMEKVARYEKLYSNYGYGYGYGEGYGPQKTG